jgi:hypothetical protein
MPRHNLVFVVVSFSYHFEIETVYFIHFIPLVMDFRNRARGSMPLVSLLYGQTKQTAQRISAAGALSHTLDLSGDGRAHQQPPRSVRNTYRSAQSRLRVSLYDHLRAFGRI